MSDKQKELAIVFLDCMRRSRKNNLNDVYQQLKSIEFFTLFSILKLQNQKEDGANPRVSELVEDLNVSPQFISKTLRSLESKGYCQRITDPSNRRSTLVILTEEGTNLLQQAQDRIFHFAQAVTERMGEENMTQFIELTHKCFDIMQDIASELYTEKEEQK